MSRKGVLFPKGYKKRDLAERFWEKVDRRGPDECWLWKGKPKPDSGYGELRVGKLVFRAHRLAYEFAKGVIPEGLIVRHKCDVRLCVNPEHLIPGTHLDNRNDMVSRGRERHPSGEEHVRCCLSDRDVERIREKYAAGITQVALAAEFDVSSRHVWDIVHNVVRTQRTEIMSQLELNRGDNFIFGVDISASMQAKDCPNNTARIEYLKETVIAFTGEASKWDEDGIDIVPFGATVKPIKGVTAEKAKEIIGALKATEGQTNTAEAINAAYKLHKDGGYKQTVFFLATDGEPSDRKAVQDAIVKISNDLKDEHEFAISFLTVGNIDPSLQSFLTALDDELKGAKHDIVDVKKLEEVDFMAAFSAALHD